MQVNKFQKQSMNYPVTVNCEIQV